MPNALAHETSPYLLQHQDNPVDWHPWGDEALAEARERDVPLLVSIGYSACHWCHVMERESFEDEETAKLMNEHFVCVKVDREEHPDVDAIYMDAVQAMTGSGGWPLNVFVTPDQVPFYGGTYFPPSPRQGMPSWRQVLGAVAEAWEQRRASIEQQSGQIVERLRIGARLTASDSPITAAAIENAVAKLRDLYDPVRGGWGGAPKFPAASTIEFLLARGEREMALETLRHMAAGGIYDQVGGGFPRYSVDASWLVPHFEKMLYDNALLARAYLHGWQVAGEERMRERGGGDARLGAARDAPVPRAASTARWTPTPRASRARSTSGRRRSSRALDVERSGTSVYRAATSRARTSSCGVGAAGAARASGCSSSVRSASARAPTTSG